MRLKLISCEVLFREMCDAWRASPHQIDVEFLPKGLHDLGGKPMADADPANRRRAAGRRYDAILLGYGLCGNGLRRASRRGIRCWCCRARTIASRC